MIFVLAAFLFGLLIGSFLNVCIYRLPRDLSVVRPRSHCIACDRMIAWYDNVPLVSFLLLRGRCRHCGAAIPLRYPAVELLTGLLFGLYAWLLGPTPEAAKFCLLGALLVGLVFTDLEERILPDELTLGGAAAGMVLAWFVPVDDMMAQALFWILGWPVRGPWVSVAEAALGALVPAFLLWFGGELYFRLRHREGLGLGDVKLLLLIGAFLGLRGSLLTLIFGSLFGSVAGYSYIRLTGKDPATYELPFGSFLGLAGIVVSLVGARVIHWYAGLY
ncbi:MAG TPA: prepilin peptidase [Bryobacteraceae bacterium]|nr:prepilin peptidase [Bryobacteraceae bacterium]